jgi:hypothetical protein
LVTSPLPPCRCHTCCCREHLLQLPHNSQAFALLQDQGLHPVFKELPQRLGLSRSSVGVRLQGCLSQLAHWCPLFGERPALEPLTQRWWLNIAAAWPVLTVLLCSRVCLLHVCAAAEVGFLPAFAFPFVKLFGPHSESAFEALATLLTNWGRGWFELFPNPPLPLLRRLLVSILSRRLG